jgi:hypothetical protein
VLAVLSPVAGSVDAQVKDTGLYLSIIPPGQNGYLTCFMRERIAQANRGSIGRSNRIVKVDVVLISDSGPAGPRSGEDIG